MRPSSSTSARTRISPPTRGSSPAPSAATAETVADWAPRFAGRRVVVLPAGAEAQPGRRRLAAPCRRPTRRRWKAASRPGARPGCRCCARRACPPRDAQGRTVWVTRARPKVDRIACPWLIRRFVDPRGGLPVRRAVGGRRRRRALRRDALRHRGDVFWSHRGELCTFDVMLEEFGLATEPLAGSPRSCAARTRRGSTSRRRRPGCSRPRSACRACIRDDLAQLDAGMALYDALLPLVPRRHRRDAQLARRAGRRLDD